MRPFQKVIAMVLALILIASAAGCVPISLTKQWSYEYSDDTLTEQLDIGVYIYALYQAYSSAQTYAEESEDYVENEPFMDIEITDDDGNTAVAEDWIKDEAEKIAVSLISIDYLVEEYGATWDEADMESAEQTSQDTWDLGPYASYGYYQPMSEELEPYGISYDSFEKSSYVASVKQSAIFTALYEEGGAEEVSDDDLTEYFVKKYVDYSYIPVQMYTSETNDDGDTTSVAFGKKKINTIISELEDYAEQLSSGSTTFKKVLKACKKDYDVTSSDAVQDSVELYSTAKSSNSNVAKAVKSLDNGKAKVVTVGKNGDSPMAYLVVKNDINGDIEEYIEGSQRTSVLQQMKSNDFTDFLEQATEDILDSDALTANTSVLNRYKPSMFFVSEDETDSDDDSDSDSDE